MHLGQVTSEEGEKHMCCVTGKSVVGRQTMFIHPVLFMSCQCQVLCTPVFLDAVVVIGVGSCNKCIDLHRSTLGS